MPQSLKLSARLAVVTLVASVLAAWPASVQARTVPETLAERRPVQAGPVQSDFPIDYLGVLWETTHDHEEHAGDPEPHGAVRFRNDGVWGPWIRLIDDGADGDGLWASGLVRGGDADAYQVRGIPSDAVDPQAVAINTTDGRPVKIGEQQGGTAGAIDNAKCRSRADWGADERLRFDSDGNEVWPPQFYEAQVMTVHHTATSNEDPDPEATVRAIYRYHAVDKGWGDIGYQYLVDESGVVYEGRWSGDASESCETTTTGDGSDFAHENTDLDGDGVTDEMVTGAHTGGWNSGNLGVALLGEFTDHPRFGGEPKAAAVDSLEDVLAELALRHGLDPLATVTYVNPVSLEEKTVDTIGGHRDYTATECPGERLYEQLPTIRQNVAHKMGASSDSRPSVAITNPTDGSTVSGTVSVTADASDDNGVSQVEFFVGASSIGVDGDGSDGWWVSWSTGTVPDGSHTVAAIATDTAGQTGTDSVGVIVDNDPDGTLAVAGTDRGESTPLVVGPNTMTVSGSGFDAGITVSLESGKGQAPTVTNVELVDSSTLRVSVTVEAKGPAGWWDVRASNADTSAACASCAYVSR